MKDGEMGMVAWGKLVGMKVGEMVGLHIGIHAWGCLAWDLVLMQGEFCDWIRPSNHIIVPSEHNS